MDRREAQQFLRIGSLAMGVVFTAASGWMFAGLEAKTATDAKSDVKSPGQPAQGLRRAGRAFKAGAPAPAAAKMEEPAGQAKSRANENEAGAPDEPEPQAGALPVKIELRDGGSVMVKLRTKVIPIATSYGRLEIPAEDVRSIVLTPRVSPDVVKKLKDAIPRLGSDKADERNAASAELFNLREKSYLALVRATKSKNKELAKRARDVVDDLRTLVPGDLRDAPAQDVLETESCRLSGEIDLASLDVSSAQFGNVELKLADVQSISPGLHSAVVVISDTRGNLSRFEREVGRTITVRVTGMAGGTVWGIGPYTTDSSMASAVVHAGLLQPGETGIVQVQILPSQNYFGGGYRNNIMAQPWTSPHTAFTIRSAARYRPRGVAPPVMMK